MVAAPNKPRRAAAAAAPATKLVCFRLGSWRYALAVDEILGLYSDLPLIPCTENGYEGLVQLKHARIPVMDLRTRARDFTENSLLPTVAVVERLGEQIALVFDFADEVIPVNSRGLLNTDLQTSPLPARARTVTRHGDVFWLKLTDLVNIRSVESDT